MVLTRIIRVNMVKSTHTQPFISIVMSRFLSKHEALLAGFLGVFGMVPFSRPAIYTRPVVSTTEAMRQDWKMIGIDMRKVVSEHDEQKEG